MSAGATTTRHQCGGVLLFVRLADGHSYERCSGCEWFYSFDRPDSAVLPSERAATA